MSTNIKRAILVAALATALLATTVAASSCGKASTAGSTTPGGSTEMTGNAEVDSFLEQLDREMSSAPVDSDFSDDQLSDSKLGI